jgi:hypothetical protein
VLTKSKNFHKNFLSFAVFECLCLETVSPKQQTHYFYSFMLSSHRTKQRAACRWSANEQLEQNFKQLLVSPNQMTYDSTLILSNALYHGSLLQFEADCTSTFRRVKRSTSSLFSHLLFVRTTFLQFQLDNNLRKATTTPSLMHGNNC